MNDWKRSIQGKSNWACAHQRIKRNIAKIGIWWEYIGHEKWDSITIPGKTEDLSFWVRPSWVCYKSVEELGIVSQLQRTNNSWRYFTKGTSYIWYTGIWWDMGFMGYRLGIYMDQSGSFSPIYSILGMIIIQLRSPTDINWPTEFRGFWGW